MDKRKVISAYRRGLITKQECAQILGIESPHVLGMALIPREAAPFPPLPHALDR